MLDSVSKLGLWSQACQNSDVENGKKSENLITQRIYPGIVLYVLYIRQSLFVID